MMIYILKRLVCTYMYVIVICFKVSDEIIIIVIILNNIIVILMLKTIIQL